MRPAVVVFRAISAIEVASVRHIKAALQRSAVFETLSRFQDVVAGEFAADFVEKLHVMVNEGSAYDSSPAKQAGVTARRVCKKMPHRQWIYIWIGSRVVPVFPAHARKDAPLPTLSISALEVFGLVIVRR